MPLFDVPFELYDRLDDLERQRWLALIRRDLPAAAAARVDWPIHRDHCFARVILDTVCGRPWREAIRAPAWRRMDDATLRKAIDLGEAILAGRADLFALDAASLAMRGKPTRRVPAGKI